MRLRWVAITVVFCFSVIGVYAVCRDQAGAVDTVVGMARRITYGALMGAGFWAASHVLQRLMTYPVTTLQPTIGVSRSSPPLPAFEVASANGAGRYRVRGFDKDTRFETIEFVYADSPSSAQMKVELKGVEVAAVEAAG